MHGSDALRVLFDDQWYVNGGPPFEGDPLLHFTTDGWRSGRDPHPLFDVAFYLEQAPELLDGDVDPLTHYITVGSDAGLSPHPLFDTAFYISRYGHALDDLNPLEHYLTEGYRMGFDPNLFFVSSYYMDRYPDVGRVMNPLTHYAVFGGAEHTRRPHPLFDAGGYALRLKLPAGVNPLTDFLRRLRALRAQPVELRERPDVSVIILNLNKSLMTIECVVSVLATTGSQTIEVVVVDNGSAADDFAHLATWLPQSVKLVRLSTNRYFGEGNNIGVEESSGRLLLFLNNDAFIGPDTIATLCRVLDTHADAGAVGPKLVYPDGRVQEAGAFISSCGTVTQRGKFLDDLPARFARTEPVDYVSAACVLLPRSLFDEAGGFDLTWDPAYYEDVDLCLKLELLGKRTYYCPDAVVTHIENATSSDQSHGLRLNTIVQINREKFISRWGDYIDSKRDRAAARVHLPEPSRDSSHPVSDIAVLFTPYPLVPGGGERYLLSIAQALSRRYRTYVLTPERYSSYRLRGIASDLELDLSEVRLHPVSDLARFANCDVFVAMGNEGLPSHAAIGRRRIFVCQFPFPMHANHLAGAWGWLDQYDDVVVYSEFAAKHFRERSRQYSRRAPHITVLPPPSPMYADAGRAARVPGRILNVGRFHPGGHCKRQDTVVEAFRRLIEVSGRQDLELHLVGTVSADPNARDFYLDVHKSAAGLPVYFHLNAPPETVRELCGSSSFYWHATGFGQSALLFPERVEHFGISVVEAMSAGAIPLVYDAGGPIEIVRNGDTGFHWHTIDGLVALTMRALTMPVEEQEAMRERAHVAARRYDAVAFDERLADFMAGTPSRTEGERQRVLSP